MGASTLVVEKREVEGGGGEGEAGEKVCRETHSLDN